MTEVSDAIRGAGRSSTPRLVYGSWFGELGGGELRLLDHLRATAFRPDRTTVLVNQPGRLVDALKGLGVGVELIRWHGGANYLTRQFHWYSAWARTWAALQRLAPDVVVCNTFFDFETTGKVAARQGRPLIWRARADTFPIAHTWPAGRLERLVALLNSKVSRILATTAYEARMMVDAGVDPSRVFVVRNGVDLARYGGGDKGSRLRGELGLAPTDFCVAFVARMVPQKGYETFFEAIARAGALGVKVIALVAGDTTLLEEARNEYKQSLREKVRRLNIEQQIHFLGFRDDIDAVMQAADVFVLASLKEPFGTTVVEAMAAARPVIASDLPGPRESLVEGETGLFFPPGDAVSLAEQLVLLSRRPSMRCRLGIAGRARAEVEFELARNIFTLDRHCLEVAEARRGRPQGS